MEQTVLSVMFVYRIYSAVSSSPVCGVSSTPALQPRRGFSSRHPSVLNDSNASQHHYALPCVSLRVPVQAVSGDANVLLVLCRLTLDIGGWGWGVDRLQPLRVADV